MVVFAVVHVVAQDASHVTGRQGEGPKILLADCRGDTPVEERVQQPWQADVVPSLGACCWLRQYLLSGGVKEALTDEGLQSLLLYDGSVDYLPLPHNAPYLTEQGIVFAYQQYEIAPYALGIPTFTLNYQKIEPYLSSAVKEMLEEGSEKR